MSVEFISLVGVNASTELHPLPERGLDVGYFRRYARTLEDHGFDRVLLPYTSSGIDPFVLAGAISQVTERLRPVVALRPNTMHPTVAAKALATLDQLTDGRAAVHLIAGGDTREQAREGDRLGKDERYDRAEEYLHVLRRAWSEPDAFDHAGRHYAFEDFRSDVRPVAGTIPISFGGSSPAAYRVGGAHADAFGLWGEPLAETRDQIDALDREARAAGRLDRPTPWVTFRPIVAATEELAWEKARRTLAAVQDVASAQARWREDEGAVGSRPENVGSQRLLDLAERGELHDRALWTPLATATGARGASTALVGTPETVAAALVDYVDLGVGQLTIRGYDNLDDAIDYGRYVIPLVREELEHRARTRPERQLSA